MTQLIQINDAQIEQIMYKDQPVVTFEQIAQVHGVPVRNVINSFQRNKEKFQEGKHFYRLDFAEATQLTFREYVSPNGLTLFPEKGYLLLCKPMRDEQSWAVQERMIDDYFALRQIIASSPAAVPQLSAQERLAEIIDCVTMADAYLQSTGQLNARDRLMSADMVRTAKLRVDAQGQATSQTLALPAPTHFDIAERVKALGYTLSRQQSASLIPRLGRAVAQEYRSRYGTEPGSTDRYVDGAVRPVKWYQLADAEWIDTIMQAALAQDGITR